MFTKIFKGINVIVTYILLIFIVLAVANVLLNGFSSILTSLQEPELIFSIKLSLVTSVISTLLCLAIALPVAYTLARYSLPAKKLTASIIKIPLALPPIVAGVCLLFLLGTTSFGEFIERLGFNFIFTVQGIILAQFFVNAPQLITLLRAAIEGIDIRFEYVARSLGCSPVKAFFKVLLPLIRNNILAGLMLTWSKALGEFGAVLMLAGSTRFKTETLPISIYLNMATGNIDALMTSASILIFIAIITLIVFEFMGEEPYKRDMGI